MSNPIVIGLSIMAGGAAIYKTAGYLLGSSSRSASANASQEKASDEAEEQLPDWMELHLRVDKEKSVEAELAREEKRLAMLEQARAKIEEFESFWADNRDRVVIIDTNVWMSERYTELFEVLPELMKPINASITIQQVQFDEITNLKNLDYNNIKSRLARRAMSRIETMQGNGVLHIQTETDEAKRGAYADSAILGLIGDRNTDITKAQLISDDTELRIRATQKLNDAQAQSYKVMNGVDFQKEIFDYRAQLRLVHEQGEV